MTQPATHELPNLFAPQVEFTVALFIPPKGHLYATSFNGKDETRQKIGNRYWTEKRGKADFFETQKAAAVFAQQINQELTNASTHEAIQCHIIATDIFTIGKTQPTTPTPHSDQPNPTR